MRRWISVPVTGAALVLTGCGGAGGGLDTSPATRAPATATDPASIPTATPARTGASTSGVTPGGSARPSGSGRYADVRLGDLADDPAAQAFAAFYDARMQAMVQHDPDLPAFRRLSTGEYLRYQEGVIARYERNGWTLRFPQRWVVTSATHRGNAASLRACQERTGPLVERTGKPAEEPTGPGAFDIRLGKRDGRWVVLHVYDAEFSCAGVL